MGWECGWLLGTLAFWERKHFFLDYVILRTLGIKIREGILCTIRRCREKGLGEKEGRRKGRWLDKWPFPFPLWNERSR